MRYLLDTHLLIWAALDDPRLGAAAAAVLNDAAVDVCFSVVSIWEAAIKHARHPLTFPIPPRDLRDSALAAGWSELRIEGAHAIATTTLPDIHGDPFDRLLVAQARAEGVVLLSSDRMLIRYGDPVRGV